MIEREGGTKRSEIPLSAGDAARFVSQPPVLEIRGRIDSTVKIRGFKAASNYSCYHE